MSTTQAISVLFVDDESLILDGLRRQLRSLRDVWNMRFAGSGAEALVMLHEQPVDVVVTDMRMPGMTGVQLLDQVHAHWPESARIILSGQTDQADLLMDIGVVHQFLQKPCDAQLLRRAITQAASVAGLAEVPQLRRIVAGLRSLPVLANRLQELLQVLQDGENDVVHIAEVVARDIGLATKLLQLVNSAFFGHPRRVTKIEDAVSLIGLRTLRQIAVAARTFDALDRESDGGRIIERLWRKSFDLAARSADLARTAGYSDDVQARAWLAASLSFVGIAVVARYMPAQLNQSLELAKASGGNFAGALEASVGVSHEVIGAYALGLWAFDDDVIRAVTFQTDPQKSGVTDSQDPLHFVHLARCAAPRTGMVEPVTPSRPFLDRLVTSSDPAQGVKKVA